jgi:hypothetical protein
VTVREGPIRQFWRPQVCQPATRVAEPLLAIETSDFDRCLQLAGASHARAAAGVYGAGSGGYLNSEARFLLQIRCRCNKGQSSLQFVIAAGQRARSIADAPTSAYAAIVLNWSLAGRTPAMRVLSRLDVRPTKKYTSALS